MSHPKYGYNSLPCIFIKSYTQGSGSFIYALPIKPLHINHIPNIYRMIWQTTANYVLEMPPASCQFQQPKIPNFMWLGCQMQSRTVVLYPCNKPRNNPKGWGWEIIIILSHSANLPQLGHWTCNQSISRIKSSQLDIISSIYVYINECKCLSTIFNRISTHGISNEAQQRYIWRNFRLLGLVTHTDDPPICHAGGQAKPTPAGTQYPPLTLI